MDNADTYFMDIALSLAAAQKGRTGDNPAVGCVIVRGGKIIGQGATAQGGRPHAEIMALRSCASPEMAAGATAYVTLEPCSHEGRSGPCAGALIKAGIRRCVVAMVDPNPRVNWQGMAQLQEAGIDTVIGSGRARAREIMANFLDQFS